MLNAEAGSSGREVRRLQVAIMFISQKEKGMPRGD